MDITQILDELRVEREQITNAVGALENLARSRGKRRGRRPAWIEEVKEAQRNRK